MPEDDALGRQAQAGRRFDVFLSAFDQCDAARDAGAMRPLHGDQRNDDLAQARAGQCQQDQRDQDRRKRELDVHQPHDEALCPAALVGGPQAQCQPDGQCHHGAGYPHQHRSPDTVDDGRQHVAALLVRAQHEGQLAVARLFARWQARIHHVENLQVVRILRRDERADDGREQHHHQQHQPGHGHLAGQIGSRETLEWRFYRHHRAGAPRVRHAVSHARPTDARAGPARNRSRPRPG